MASGLAGKTVGVYHGLLRFLVLQMLNEKPMSGVEIAQQIEKQTGAVGNQAQNHYTLCLLGC